jgi:hypothetical protein
MLQQSRSLLNPLLGNASVRMALREFIAAQRAEDLESLATATDRGVPLLQGRVSLAQDILDCIKQTDAEKR